jgi:putative spermidine/putrescine transport system substrate-binding protein
LTDCAVGEIVWSTVVAFDRTKFANKRPWTIKDFFNVADFPGKRGMRKSPRVNLEWALMADGVPNDQVYEVLATSEGVDRAFAVLDSIKPHVIWWETGAQPPQLLADGEVAMTSAYNGRLFNAIFKEKKPFVIIWDGQVWDIDLWGIVKGTPNLAAALEFIKFATDTTRLADQAKYISYGPVRRSSMDRVNKKMKPHLPTSPDNFANSLQNDYQWWADNQQEMDERFTAWLAR